MDYTKNVVVLLALLLLVNVASAEFFVDVGESLVDFNYADYPITAFGTPLDDGVPQLHEVRVFNNNVYQNAVYIKLIDNDASHNLTATITVDCPHNNKTLTLGAFSNWNNEGWMWVDTTLFNGNINQTVGSLTNETSEIDLSSSCYLTLDGEDALAVTYINIETISQENVDLWATAINNRFAVPDQSMADIVINASIVTASAFSLIEIMLAISAVMLLIFLIIATWTLVESIAKRVRGRGEEV